jgi:hypothetical protein
MDKFLLSVDNRAPVSLPSQTLEPVSTLTGASHEC